MLLPDLIPGSHTTLTLTGVDAIGNAVTNFTPTFSVDNTGVATVAQSPSNPFEAVLSGLSVGNTLLTVTGGAVTLTATVNVSEPVVAALDIAFTAPAGA